MIVCWDASAIVKLLLEEDGTQLAASIWHGEVATMAPTLVRPEVASALARSTRAGDLAAPAYEAAVVVSRQLFDEIDLLAVTDARAGRAADLVTEHELRGADAVYLATALDVADLGAEVVLATWDRRLHEAAVTAGIGVAPTEL